jgi:hypothetical protein
MNKTLCTLIAACALGATLPAHAIRVVDVATTGASTVLDFSAPGLLAFDIDLRDKAPLLLKFEIEAGDLGGAIDFNAVIRNLSGQGLGLVDLQFGSGGVAQAGSVQRFFGGDSQLTGGGAQWRIELSPLEYYDLEIGDAFGSSAGATNWRLDASGWQVGDKISLAIAVPEPGTAALLLGGLALIGSRLRRRTRTGG